MHDQTVADDYYQAMERVEKRLELLGAQEETGDPVGETEGDQLLAFASQLVQPALSVGTHLEIAAWMHTLLNGMEMAWGEPPINDYGRKQWEHPLPSPVLLGAG